MKVPIGITDTVTLQRVRKLVNGELTFQDNFKSYITTVANTGAADTQFTVDHGLGFVPRFYFWNIDRSGFVYDDSRITWTDTQLTLKCSAANASLVLVIF